MFTRDKTRSLRVGRLTIGGGAPVSVQTMTNVSPHDRDALSSQIERCAEAGAEVIRLTVPDQRAAAILGEVKKRSPIPIIADIHFDYRCALAAIAAGADALRLNPGNIGGQENVRAVARAAKEKRIPIRIGVNGGSLEEGESLVSSALKHLKLLEDEGFFDVALSVKASDVRRTLDAYRELASQTDCPLHLGVTEAGTFLRGTVHSAVALGILLDEGLGDTIRVSLTDAPEREVRVGLEILRASGLRAPGPSVTSCPTCGRTKANVMKVAEEVEIALEKLARASSPGAVQLPHVAVMGCVVNGPGEAKDADIALCGGVGEFMLYEHGVFVRRFPEDEAAAQVLEAVRRHMGRS